MTHARAELFCAAVRPQAQAQRKDLSSIAATRAIYVAGEDRRGRTCVVFSPDLVNHQSPAPLPKNKSLKKRGNSQPQHIKLEVVASQQQRRRSDTPTAGSRAVDADVFSSPAWDSSPRSQSAGRPDKTAVVGSHSTISRRGASCPSPRDRHSEIPAAKASDPGGAVAAGGSLVALESNVGSAAMEHLLLYFVRVMDAVADGEYVLLLCDGCSGGVGEGDHSGKIGGKGVPLTPGAERTGWLSWGRFSMLGQMHSLLPRR